MYPEVYWTYQITMPGTTNRAVQCPNLEMEPKYLTKTDLQLVKSKYLENQKYGIP